MSIILTSHATAEPALFGAMAAVVAHTLGASLRYLPHPHYRWPDADAAQWVTADGHLVPSGLAWYERLTARPIGAPSTIEEVLEISAQQVVVLAWHPEINLASEMNRLIAGAAARGIPVQRLTVEQQASGELCIAQDIDNIQFGRWHRDAFGRLHQGPRQQAQHASCTLALLGTAHEHVNVYPAALASLGDAIETCGGDVAVRFVAAQAFQLAELDGIDGIVLPGGSDMANVPGQLRAAHYGLEQRLPVLGLCLGMQSMATAFAQTLGVPANLEEVDAAAPVKSFVAMAPRGQLPTHRLGDQPLRIIAPDLATLLGPQTRLRCNHRYYLNPQLGQALDEGGMQITATDETGFIADAIDVHTHPFYRGMQGHPEQSSRRGQPHPLITAFVMAAINHARGSRLATAGQQSSPGRIVQ